MAQRPTNPSPYMFRVDATQEIEFSFLVADIDIFTSVDIRIRENELRTGESDFRSVATLNLKDGILQYTKFTYNDARDYTEETAIIVGDFPKKIVGGRGLDSRVTLPLPADTLSNGNAYKWQIENIGDTREFYFETASKPIVSFSSEQLTEAEEGCLLSSSSAIFDGAAVDDSGAVVDTDYYRWEIIRYDDTAVLEYSSSQQYNVSLRMDYSRFVSGNTYMVTLYVKPKMWPTETSYSKLIVVKYESARAKYSPEVKVEPYRNRLLLDFSKMSRITGASSEEGGYSVDNGFATVALGNTIEWNSVDDHDLVVPKDTGFAVKFRLNADHYGKLFEATYEGGSLEFGYNAGFYYIVNGGAVTYIDMSSYGFFDENMFSEEAEISDGIFRFYDDTEINFASTNTYLKIEDSATEADTWWIMRYNGASISLWLI